MGVKRVEASRDGAKLRDLLTTGITLTRGIEEVQEKAAKRVAALQDQRSKVEKELLNLLKTYERDPHDPITFALSDGRGCEISWKKEYPVDYTSAMQLEKSLGVHFPKVFSVRPAINRAKSFVTWMKADQGPLNRLKDRVQACVEERFTGPKFKWNMGKKK